MPVLRTNETFWETGFLDYTHDDYITDGLGHVVARRYAYELEPEHVFRPVVLKNLRDLPERIVYNGWVYDIQRIIRGLKSWKEFCINETQYNTLLEFLTCLVHLENFYWDKTYRFPCVWDPDIDFQTLQYGSMADFLTQWPCDRYVFTVGDDNTLDTWTMSTVSTLTDVITFQIQLPDWEVFRDGGEEFTCEQCEETKEE